MPLNNYGRRLTQELTPLNDKRHVDPSADHSDSGIKALNASVRPEPSPIPPIHLAASVSPRDIRRNSNSPNSRGSLHPPSILLRARPRFSCRIIESRNCCRILRALSLFEFSDLSDPSHSEMTNIDGFFKSHTCTSRVIPRSVTQRARLRVDIFLAIFTILRMKCSLVSFTSLSLSLSHAASVEESRSIPNDPSSPT